MRNQVLQQLLDKKMTRKKFLGLGAFAVASLVGGGALLRALQINADTLTTASLEAENATASPQTTVVNDATASGGKALQFGSVVTMPPSTGNESLTNRVVGPTSEAGVVKVKTRSSGTGGSGRVRLKIGTDQAVTQNVVYSAPVPPSALGDAMHTVTGLSRGQTYYYRVQMNSTLDNHAVVGRIVVAPNTATSFAFCFASCCNTADHGVFEYIRNRNDPLFLHLGDLWYADNTGQTIENFRNRMNLPLSTDKQGALYATTPLSYTPSDHDAGMKNESVGELDGPALALFNQAYRENFATPLVQATSGVYHTFVYGRVRFIVLDGRTFKSNPAATDNASKTMLGATQKQWLKDTITASAQKVIVIANDVPWAGPTQAGADHWSGYNTERVEIGNFINASGKKAVIIGGDMHALAHSSGASYGRGIPNYQGAPLVNAASIKGAPWDALYPTTAGATMSQYGRVVVTDTGGSTIRLVFTGYSAEGVARISRTDTFTV